MSETLTLTAETRQETGRRTNQLRKQGFIPAVMYGHGFAPQHLQVGKIAFQKLYREAGESTLVDLAVGSGAPMKVLIQDIQVDPLRGDVTHIDFRQVRMDEKLEADIELRFIDESPAVKELGGTLVKNMSHFKVRCLPSALVHEIDVSIAPLAAFENKIHVRDIALPDGIEVLHSVDEVVAFVEEPRSEEEMKELESTPETGVEQVKVIAEEKKAEREKEKEEAEKKE